jgi:hypothetical protein
VLNSEKSQAQAVINSEKSQSQAVAVVVVEKPSLL